MSYSQIRPIEGQDPAYPPATSLSATRDSRQSPRDVAALHTGATASATTSGRWAEEAQGLFGNDMKDQGHADMEDDEYNSLVAAGKVISILMKKGKAKVKPETSSVYGAAIVMPQLARSAGWSRMLTYLAIRSYMFLVVNVIVQMALLFLISEEEVVMDGFAGQMYLCDFGATLKTCPDGPGCVGPGGTKFTPARLYGWDSWANRRFVKDSLLLLFPERKEDIENLVDPGEYGLESYWCRVLCCFLFMMSVMSDLYGTIEMCYLNWKVPTRDEFWLKYEVPTWGSKAYCKAVRGWSELDLVQIVVAGMPMFWKVFNTVFVALPKLMLWYYTSRAGTTFLMETSSIEDLIVNSIALTFILSIDEYICENFTTQMTRTLLDKLEGFEVVDTSDEEKYTDLQSFNVVQEEARLTSWGIRDIIALMPSRLLFTLAMTTYFVDSYYRAHCVRGRDGDWISQAMYGPVDISYNVANFAFPQWFPFTKSAEPFWTSAVMGQAGQPE